MNIGYWDIQNMWLNTNIKGENYDEEFNFTCIWPNLQNDNNDKPK